MSPVELGARKPAPPFPKPKHNPLLSRDDHAMIAFSTCWNSGRHTSGEEMLREIQAIGFNLIELGHGIRISLIPGIQKMFDAGEVRFSSLHNFCPLPVEVMAASPECYQFSAVYPQERERAIKRALCCVAFGCSEHETHHRSTNRTGEGRKIPVTQICLPEVKRRAKTREKCSYLHPTRKGLPASRDRLR